MTGHFLRSPFFQRHPVVFVDFANPICGFSIFGGDFLGRSGKMVILYHKHHGAISSLSGWFVHLCVFINCICGFCKCDLWIFWGISWVGVVTRSFFIISTMGLSPRKQILSLWVMLYLWISANRICGPILVYFLCNYAL